MDNYNNRRSLAVKIPPHRPDKPLLVKQQKPVVKDTSIDFSSQLFAEISINSEEKALLNSLPSETVTAVPDDEIRELFYKMKDYGRRYDTSGFGTRDYYYRNDRQKIAKVFYLQAKFMEDFEDDYELQIPFSAYFPNYNMMSYHQLRTYFSWRTKIRQGEIKPLSLSYGFLYVYELLNNIKVKNSAEGLDKLLSFWQAYREFDSSMDKYLSRWLKDYHIYYPQTQRFSDFIERNNLEKYYTLPVSYERFFDLFSFVSRYDIKNSVFYKAGYDKNLIDCFDFVLEKLQKACGAKGISLFTVIFRPDKGAVIWYPFKDALFYEEFNQRDHSIVVNEKEVYYSYRKRWYFSSRITSSAGKSLITYLLRKTEAILRVKMNYKKALKCDVFSVDFGIKEQLSLKDEELEGLIEAAVLDYLKDLRKVVVDVDSHALAKIRAEALLTQEKLLVDEQSADINNTGLVNKLKEDQEVSLTGELPILKEDPFLLFCQALSDKEIQAIKCLLNNQKLKDFADSHKLMLEVLIEAINEKACEFINDNLIGDDQKIYAEYQEELKGISKDD